MSEAMPGAEPRQIMIEEDFPNRADTLWRALTEGPLVARWLGMEPQGFKSTPGTRFTYRTDPAGAWDGTIHCEVLDAVPERRLAYSWRGGHAGNVGYGAPLDTVVTMTLEPIATGTRLRLVHSGFRLPRNANAYSAMSKGWAGCAVRMHDVANDA